MRLSSRCPSSGSVACSPGPSGCLGLELLFVVVPYLLTVTHFAMWWGGWSPPAFLCRSAPAVRRSGRGGLEHAGASRAVASAALVLTATASRSSSASIAVASRSTRGSTRALARMARPVADLTTAALPGRATPHALFRSILIWAGVLAVSWMVLSRAERAGYLRPPVQMQTADDATLATAIMLAASVVWAFEGASDDVGLLRAQLLERLAAQPRVLACS